MPGGMRIDWYDCPAPDPAPDSSASPVREPLLRFGPDDAPRVLVSLPLFEEYNRTRAFAVTLLRALAARGVGGLLPDWPGTGESLLPTEGATLAGMRAAFLALARAAGPVHVVAIRSGALIDAPSPDVRGRWRLSPQGGADLVRELARLTDPATGLVAGNRVGAALLAELPAASAGVPAADRIVRLASDPRPADRIVAAAPLWRRAEPGNDAALATVLADDIAAWIGSCAA